MKDKENEEMESISEFSEKVLRGMELAYEQMIKFKRYKNSPLIVSDKDGNVVEIDPFEAPSTTTYK